MELVILTLDPIRFMPFVMLRGLLQVQLPAGTCTVSSGDAEFIAAWTSGREQLAALIIPPPLEATENEMA